MKRTLLLIIPIALIIISLSCKKDKIETPPPPPSAMYTVSGTIINGTTNKPYAQTQVSVFLFHNRNNLLPFGILKTLGYVDTDDLGRFTFSYPKQDTANLYHPRVMIRAYGFSFDSIPLNQDVDKKFYASTLATLKINLTSNNPLKAGDTLFLAYDSLDAKGKRFQHTDMITSPINGYYKTLKTRIFELKVFWGRGHDEFNELLEENQVTTLLNGDPIVNEVTVKY